MCAHVGKTLGWGKMKQCLVCLPPLTVKNLCERAQFTLMLFTPTETAHSSNRNPTFHFPKVLVATWQFSACISLQYIEVIQKLLFSVRHRITGNGDGINFACKKQLINSTMLRVAFYLIVASMSLSYSSASDASSKASFNFIFPRREIIDNCLAARHEEVNKLKLRVAGLEYQLSRERLRNGDVAPTSATPTPTPSPLNPSFHCNCQNDSTSFTFGFGGRLINSFLSILRHVAI